MLAALMMLQEQQVGWDLVTMWHNMGIPAKAVVFILFVMSAWSVGIMIDRALMYSAARKQSRVFVQQVAGALKDNQRCKVVGQTTYGKGTTQRILRLEAAPAGIRVTLARFFSPSGQAYSGRGVTPDVLVERTPLDLTAELRQQPQIRAALQVARGLWKDEP